MPIVLKKLSMPATSCSKCVYLIDLKTLKLNFYDTCDLAKEVPDPDFLLDNKWLELHGIHNRHYY